jgi:hypothetical protein
MRAVVHNACPLCPAAGMALFPLEAVSSILKGMPWNITVHPKTGIVETLYGGRLSPTELQAAVLATIEQGRKRGATLYLGNCTSLEGGHSVTDLYFLADLLQSLGLTSEFHEAILLPQLEAAAEDVQFWETTTRNRGCDVRVFRDREAALAWLKR